MRLLRYLAVIAVIAGAAWFLASSRIRTGNTLHDELPAIKARDQTHFINQRPATATDDPAERQLPGPRNERLLPTHRFDRSPTEEPSLDVART